MNWTASGALLAVIAIFFWLGWRSMAGRRPIDNKPEPVAEPSVSMWRRVAGASVAFIEAAAAALAIHALSGWQLNPQFFTYAVAGFTLAGMGKPDLVLSPLEKTWRWVRGQPPTPT